jgi:arsenical pump membrane protein
MAVFIWAVAALSLAGVIFQPFRWPEYRFACGGAALLVLTGALSPLAAVAAVGQGGDVYLFLAGMMALAAVADSEGLFAWAAAHTARAAAGAGVKLFALIYALAVVVTIFLSNDATAVVMTPAVAAMARAAKVQAPLPYLLICAFVANAASFVLPISNPANLVVFGQSMPSLFAWLREFGLASLAAILVTFAILFLTQWRAIGPVGIPEETAALSPAGRHTAYGLLVTAAVLLIASAAGWQLGLPTALAAAATVLAVRLPAGEKSPLTLLHGISWSTLALVAGLFVLVAALDRAGAARLLANGFAHATIWSAGFALGFGCNLVNNLPAGLAAAHALTHAPAAIRRAALIGVDLGPNLSVTGSLATILWLAALRRENIACSAWQFLRIGIFVMPPALAAALLSP